MLFHNCLSLHSDLFCVCVFSPSYTVCSCCHWCTVCNLDHSSENIQVRKQTKFDLHFWSIKFNVPLGVNSHIKETFPQFHHIYRCLLLNHYVYLTSPSLPSSLPSSTSIYPSPSPFFPLNLFISPSPPSLPPSLPTPSVLSPRRVTNIGQSLRSKMKRTASRMVARMSKR